MSDRIEEQIARMVDVIDAELPPITVDELNTMLELPLTPMPARRFPGPVVAVAAAVAVVVFVGGIALLTGFFEDPPPADSVVPPSTPETAPLTTLPVTTTVAQQTAGSGINWVDVEWSRVPDASGVLGGAGSQYIEAVTIGGPGLVAVGTDCGGYCGVSDDDSSDAAVWVSADGVDWTRIPHDEAVFGGPGAQNMIDVVSGGPGLVAVGIVDHAYFGFRRSPQEFRPGEMGVFAPSGREDLDAAVWTSEDGLTWELVPDPDGAFSGTGDGSSTVAGDEAMEAVAVGAGRIVAVGSAHEDAAVWVSNDGVSWQRVPHDDEVFGGPSGQWMHDVVYTGERFVAVGTDLNGAERRDGGIMRGAVWTSEDGSSWSRVEQGAEVFGGDIDKDNPLFIWTVTSTANGLVAAGMSSCFCDTPPAEMPLWISQDGLEWERIADDSAPFAYLPTSTKRLPNGSDLRHAPVKALAAFEDGVLSVGWDRGFAQVMLPDVEIPFDHDLVPGQLYTSVAMTDLVIVGNQALAVGYSLGEAAIWIGTITD